MRNSALQAQLCRAPHCRRCPPTGDHGAYRRLVDHRHPQHVRTPLPFPRVIADHQPGPDDCCSPPRPQLHACCTPASASTRTGSQLASLTCDNISRGGEARTPDPLLPKQVRYHCATPRSCHSCSRVSLSGKWSSEIADQPIQLSTGPSTTECQLGLVHCR